MKDADPEHLGQQDDIKRNICAIAWKEREQKR